MTLSFKSIGSTDQIATVGPDDNIVVLTTSGLRQIKKSDFTTLLASNLTPLNEWDAQASEVQATPDLGIYGFRSVMTDVTAAAMLEATLDQGTLTASNVDAQAAAIAYVFRLNGALPTTGKYWMVWNVTAYTADPLQARQRIHFLDDISQLATLGVSLAYTSITVQRTAVTFNLEAGATSDVASISYGTADLKNILIMLDIDNDQIIVKCNGSTMTATLPTGSLAKRGIVGSLYRPAGTYGNVNSQAFNFTDAGTAPTAPDVGALPLVLSNAVLPNYAGMGTGIRSWTNSSYHGQKITAYETYFIASDRLLQIPDIIRTPQLDTDNVFAKPIQSEMGVVGRDNNNFFLVQPGDIWPMAYAASSGAVNSNVVAGQTIGQAVTGASSNVLMGFNLLAVATTSVSSNVVLGTNLLTNIDGLSNNVVIGSYSCNQLRGGSSTGSVVLGYGALSSGSGYYASNLIAIGANVLSGWKDPTWDGSNPGTLSGMSAIAIGADALSATLLAGVGAAPTGCVAIGNAALKDLTGNNNIAIGATAGGQGTINDSVLIGQGTFYAGLGNANVLVGQQSAAQLSKQQYSVGVGYQALYNSADANYSVNGSYNVALGYMAMTGYTGNQSVGVGASTLTGGSWSNAAALGYQATVTGDNQVQLGNASTTTYAYGAVQNRSDVRDKTDIRDTLLGLAFIEEIRAVDFRWDMREDYIDYGSLPVAPDNLRQEPLPPSNPNAKQLAEYQLDHKNWLAEKSAYDVAFSGYSKALAQWQEANSFSKIKHDGSKKRKRYHHGVLAQQVKTVMEKLGVDFGGYQDHLFDGGQDVKSVGYEEFIGPLIKAVQELAQMVRTAEQENANLTFRLEQAEGRFDTLDKRMAEMQSMMQGILNRR